MRRAASRLALAAAVLVVLGAVAFSTAAAVGMPTAQRASQRPFTIKGDLRAPLHPGASRRLDPTLTNRYRFKLAITRLSVRVGVDRKHRRAGCSVRRDFAVRQLASDAYPVGLPRLTTRRLSTLRVRLPRLRMRYLAHHNQDACKGARLRLTYRAVARRARP